MKVTAVVAALLMGGCSANDLAAQVGSGVDTQADTGDAPVVQVAAQDAARTAGPTVTVPMHAIDAKGVGKEIGTLMLADTDRGLRIETALGALPPGPHGFHVHAKDACGPAVKEGKETAGEAAGGHFDPAHTGKHLGPEGAGHKGDLPVLTVDAQGNATDVLFAPHLKLADVKGKAFMIHAGGDNYSDKPAPLGGGGARIACGTLD